MKEGGDEPRMNPKSKSKMTSGEGTEEKRGGEGTAPLCLSSPPNATHVRGLGNNESPSQWDCRHYRVCAASLCERQLCRCLSFSRRLLPCDRVTSLFSLPLLPFGRHHSGAVNTTDWWLSGLLLVRHTRVNCTHTHTHILIHIQVYRTNTSISIIIG